MVIIHNNFRKNVEINGFEWQPQGEIALLTTPGLSKDIQCCK